MIEPDVLRRVTDAVEDCWNEGSPVAGRRAEEWQRTAEIAIRRISSFARRDVPIGNRQAQINDITNGLIQAFEDQPRLVGPLKIDYEYVAQQALDAATRENRSEKTS